ncbi:MAG TPA: RsmB/NOP family class I SAM-dependent RNA methyltransferase, partial [Ignavibacteriaceae bacterium]
MSRRTVVSDKIYGYLSAAFGDEAAKNYWDFARQLPAKYIRVNQIKISRDKLADQLLEEYGVHTEKLQFPSNALKVVNGYDYAGSTFEIAFGMYYIQGYSSMLPPIALNPNSDEMVLDMCSAPGSKTTQLAEMMGNKGTLVVNEIHIDRIKALVYNLDKMNFVNFGVLNARGEFLNKYYDAKFDKILVDAPCSGLGIIQKKSEVNKWWTPERVSRLCEIQTKLLVSAIKMLKVGGEVLYSTCTLTVEENELVINKLLERYPVEVKDLELPIEHHSGLTTYHGERLHPDLSKAIRIFPWEADSDGFFMIKLKKTGETVPPEQSKFKKSYVVNVFTAEDDQLKIPLIALSEEFGIDQNIFSEYKFLLKRNDIYFVNRTWNDENLGLYHRIGTKFGSLDKDNKIVLHSYAAQILHKHITKNIYEITDIEELKTYLRGGLILKDSIPPGQYV